MIEALNVSKSFGDKQVLHNISLKFEKGRTNLIIGRSGCGKSVFLKCMVGLEKVDNGKIYYNKREFTSMPFRDKKEVRKEIGMLFQGGALFDSMTVMENVVFPLKMFTDMTKGEMTERAQFCLNRVNLDKAGHLFPAEISGGMKKRVGIARAIALNPQYLFIDEPNSGLDPQTAIVIDSLIKEITEEFDTTTIIVTHDMNSVMEIGENIAFFHQGRVWWEGNKDELVRSDNPELNDFVFASTFMRRYKETYVDR